MAPVCPWSSTSRRCRTPPPGASSPSRQPRCAHAFHPPGRTRVPKTDANVIDRGSQGTPAGSVALGFTLVTFHAHPDDESIATAGTMARAKAEGHRVVLVVATRGELGEYAPDALADGETLAERRVAEQHAAAEVLGVDRVEYLGYRDSGMDGEPSNHDAGAFA